VTKEIERTEYKRMHPSRVNARRIAELPHLYDPSYRKLQLNKIESEAVAYNSQTKQSIVVLKGRTEEGPVALAIPYITRLQPGYLRKSRSAVADRLRGLGVKGTFITLTVDPKQYVSLIEASKSANRQLNTLLTEIRREYPGMKYVAIRESQSENANVHIHMCVNIPYISHSWLAEHWKLGYVWVERVISGSRRTLEWYMRKEMDKSLSMIDGHYSPTMLLLWATGMRYLSNSRSLDVQKEKTNSNGFWEYVGVFPAWMIPDQGGGMFPYDDFAYMADLCRLRIG